MKSTRALERAIRLLKALERRPASSLKDLHAETGIPKPTLLRLLATLESERLVWRAMGDGLYRTRVLLMPAVAQHKHLRLAEVAAPHLSALRRKVVWPSDLTVRHGCYMKLIETSRRESSLAIHRDAIGFRINMPMSAVGRSYLAFCSPAERERLLIHFRRHPQRYAGSGAFDEGALNRALHLVRERGYALRDPKFGGLGWLRDDQDDGLSAIAVPVISGGQAFASLNIVWPRQLMSEGQIARRYLSELHRAAQAIGASAGA